MALSDIPEERNAQVSAIERQLATAPKIQEDLKAKFGIEDNFLLGSCNLLHYRLNNSRSDIAEKLAREHGQTVEERYDLINDQPVGSVSFAFRGYHDEEFMADYQFNGVFCKELNDYIKEIRKSEGGRIGGRKVADMVNPETEERYVVEAGRASVETHGDQMRNGGLIGGRKGNEAQGNHLWSLEEVADMHKFREESYNHSSKFNPNSPNWDYTTSKMNEKYDEKWTTKQVIRAYEYNKHLLADGEE
jgi:hypothetical protein